MGYLLILGYPEPQVIEGISLFARFKAARIFVCLFGKEYKASVIIHGHKKVRSIVGFKYRSDPCSVALTGVFV